MFFIAERISLIRQQYSKGFSDELNKMIVPVPFKTLDCISQPLNKILITKGV